MLNYQRFNSNWFGQIIIIHPEKFGLQKLAAILPPWRRSDVVMRFISEHSDSRNRNTVAGWWLQPLWKYWSVGMIIPNIWKNKKCSKPPTKCSCILNHFKCDSSNGLNMVAWHVQKAMCGLLLIHIKISYSNSKANALPWAKWGMGFAYLVFLHYWVPSGKLT